MTIASPSVSVAETTLRRPRRRIKWGLIFTYVLVIIVPLTMLAPFVWMLSASVKLDRDVFAFPIQWIPEMPRWENYIDIWTKIPLGIFVWNTTKLTLIVTVLQLLTSSFAAYAFAKLNFPQPKLAFPDRSGCGHGNNPHENAGLNAPRARLFRDHLCTPESL